MSIKKCFPPHCFSNNLLKLFVVTGILQFLNWWNCWWNCYLLWGKVDGYLSGFPKVSHTEHTAWSWAFLASAWYQYYTVSHEMWQKPTYQVRSCKCVPHQKWGNSFRLDTVLSLSTQNSAITKFSCICLLKLCTCIHLSLSTITILPEPASSLA